MDNVKALRSQAFLAASTVQAYNDGELRRMMAPVKPSIQRDPPIVGQIVEWS